MQNLLCPAKDLVCANKYTAINILGLKSLVEWCCRGTDLWWVSCDIRNRLPYFLGFHVDLLAFLALSLSFVLFFVVFGFGGGGFGLITSHNWCVHVLETVSLKCLRNYFYPHFCFHWYFLVLFWHGLSSCSELWSRSVSLCISSSSVFHVSLEQSLNQHFSVCNYLFSNMDEFSKLSDDHWFFNP